MQHTNTKQNKLQIHILLNNESKHKCNIRTHIKINYMYYPLSFESTPPVDTITRTAHLTKLKPQQKQRFQRLRLFRGVPLCCRMREARNITSACQGYSQYSTWVTRRRGRGSPFAIYHWADDPVSCCCLRVPCFSSLSPPNRSLIIISIWRLVR